MRRQLFIVPLLATCSVMSAFAGDCQVFSNAVEFQDFMEQHGMVLRGVENFEESNVPAGAEIVLPNPLQTNVANVNAQGIGFPTGLTLHGIVLQDNVTFDCNPQTPNPGDRPANDDLFIHGQGTFNSPSVKAGPNFNHVTLDLLFPDQQTNQPGVGFALWRSLSGPWNITVFAPDGTELHRFDVPEGPPGSEEVFVGIGCGGSIGRINICAGTQGARFEVVDDIQLWEERPVAVDPATWGSIKHTYDR